MLAESPPIPFPGDSYDSPTMQRNMPLFPTWAFFWKLMHIIYRDGVLAKQGLYTGEMWTKGSSDTLRALEESGGRVHVRGMDNLQKVPGPCIFIGNHMSTLETFVLPCFIQPRKNVTFVVKDTLTSYPAFGTVLRSRDPIIVARKNPRQDLAAVLEGGEERLSGGTSIIIFPQSTRSHTFNQEQFNSIGIKLAKRTGMPVVPLALRTDAWGIGPVVKDLGRIHPELPVHFRFGEPLTVTGNGKAEHAQLCEFIKTNLDEWSLPVAMGTTSHGS